MAASFNVTVIDTIGNPVAKTITEGATVRDIMRDFGMTEGKVKARLNGAACSDLSTPLTSNSTLSFSPAKTDSAAL